MSYSSSLIYSDNACSAFLSAIAESFEREIGGAHYLGRTAMQKLAYFSKALGVPIPCSFEIFTYGPYSDTITFCVDSLLADDVLRDISKDPGSYSNYRLGENAEEILRRYRELLDGYGGKIDAVVRSLGRFKPPDLELIATLHFIHHRFRRIARREPSKHQVFREFRRIKGLKFSQKRVDAFYAALQRAKLIDGSTAVKKRGASVSSH